MINTFRIHSVSELIPKGFSQEQINQQIDSLPHEMVFIPDSPNCSMQPHVLTLCSLVRERGKTPVMGLNCRDHNRIDMRNIALSARLSGAHKIVIYPGRHNSLGLVPDARAVYDLDPVQALKMLADQVNEYSETTFIEFGIWFKSNPPFPGPTRRIIKKALKIGIDFALVTGRNSNSVFDDLEPDFTILKLEPGPGSEFEEEKPDENNNSIL